MPRKSPLPRAEVGLSDVGVQHRAAAGCPGRRRRVPESVADATELEQLFQDAEDGTGGESLGITNWLILVDIDSWLI